MDFIDDSNPNPNPALLGLAPSQATPLEALPRAAPPPGWHLIDARARAVAHPSTFSVPSLPDARAVKPGMLVKVGLGRDPSAWPTELCWLAVTAVHRTPPTNGYLAAVIYLGRLEHETVSIPMPAGDRMWFEPRHIMDVDGAEDERPTYCNQDCPLDGFCTHHITDNPTVACIECLGDDVDELGALFKRLATGTGGDRQELRALCWALGAWAGVGVKP